MALEIHIKFSQILEKISFTKTRLSEAHAVKLLLDYFCVRGMLGASDAHLNRLVVEVGRSLVQPPQEQARQ